MCCAVPVLPSKLRLTADMLKDPILYATEFTMQACAHDALDGSRGHVDNDAKHSSSSTGCNCWFMVEHSMSIAFEMQKTGCLPSLLMICRDEDLL